MHKMVPMGEGWYCECDKIWHHANDPKGKHTPSFQVPQENDDETRCVRCGQAWPCEDEQALAKRFRDELRETLLAEGISAADAEEFIENIRNEAKKMRQELRKMNKQS